MGKFKDYLLGGPVNSVVGDGRVLVPTNTPSTSPNLRILTTTSYRPSSSNSSISNISMGSTPHDNLGGGNSRASSVTTSPNPFPISPDRSINESPSRSSQHLERHDMTGKPTRVPSGVRAPRSSLAPPPPSLETEDSPRPSMESFYTASQVSIEESAIPVETLWQDYEIPDELGLMKEDTPGEIRNIVQESLDEHKVIRISRMQASALTKLTANDSSISHTMTQDMDQNPESGEEDKSPLNPLPRSNWPIRNTSQGSVRAIETASIKNLSATMSDLEKKFQESRIRTRKSYKNFKILPGRKMTDEPTPPLLKVEPTVIECISCFDEIPDNKGVALPCHHSYCQPCFSHLISTAIHSEDTFPPKCCLSEVPKTTIHRQLPAKEWNLYSDKALEYAVPIANRYYCASPACAKWIDARNAKRTDGALQCPHCKAKLCTVCRGPSHPSNEDCPQDFGMDRLMEEAEWSGWRRCSQCRTLVERKDGCLHITCKCHYQFCYCCGAKVGHCRCTEADQRRREEEGRIKKEEYEAKQRAEQEEVRAAIAAVEAAERAIQQERKEEEARIAHEAREIEQLEVERLSNIADYYEYLHGVLECVRLQQRHTIEKRHDQEWAGIDRIRDEIEAPDMTLARERIADAEMTRIVGEVEAKIREVQRSHAHAMMETITRHRRAQDELLAASMSAQDAETEIKYATRLEDLMPTQEAERSALNFQQKSEMQNWRERWQTQLGGFDVKGKILQLRLKDLEDITRREKELKTKITADSKWFELLFDERITMLSEDQNRMMKSGADAPSNPNKRDTVVMPKNEPTSASGPAKPTVQGLSMGETLGIATLGIATLPVPSPTSPRSPTTPLRRTNRTHRANSGRSNRYEPDWDEIHAIANAHRHGNAKTPWHHGALGAQVRVG